MSDKQKAFGIANVTLLASGLFCAGLGLVVMFGWHTHRPSLIRFLPSPIGMSYNAAVLFLSCGIGLIAMGFARPLVTRICATVVSALSLAIIFEYAFGINLGIDQLIVNDFPTGYVNNPYPGRMALISAISFLLAAIAMFLISWPRNFKKKSCSVGAVGSLVFSAGISVFLGYVFGALSIFGWGTLTRMAMNTAAGFLVMGAALIVFAWLEDRCAGYNSPCWSPVLVCALVVMTTFGLSQSLAKKDDLHVNQTTALEQESLKAQINSQMEYRISTLLRMAKHIENEKHTSIEEWEDDIAFYIGHVAGYRGMMWLDADPHARISKFRSGVVSNEPTDLDFARSTKSNGENKQATVVRRLDSNSGPEGFIARIPVYHNDKLEGVILCEFDTSGFVESILKLEVLRDYSFVLYDRNTEIYKQSNDVFPDDKYLIPQAPINMYGLNWTLRVWPKPATIASEESSLDEATLATGLVLALLLGWVMYLLHTAKTRQRETEAQSIQRLQAEARLQESETRYRDLIELGHGLVCTHTLDGILLSVNPVSARLLGYEPAELIGRNIEVITAPSFKQYLGYYHQCIKNNKEASGLWYVITKAGKILIWQYHNVLLEREGAPLYVLGHAQDVTETKRAEEEIRAGKELLHSFVKHTPAAVAMFDKEMRYLMTSDQWLTDYRIDRETVIGESHYDIFPKISSSLKELFERCLAGACERGDDYIYTQPDGSIEYLQWEIHPWFKSRDEIGGIIIGTRFTTKRRKAEKERERLISIIEATSDLIGVAGMDTKISYSNKAGRRMLGLGDKEDLSNLSFSEFLTDESFDLIVEEAIPTAMQRGIWSGESTMRTREGKEIPVSQIIIAHKDRNGQIDFTATVARDISEAKKAAEELTKAKEVAESANQAKSDFLANMSHEIRTPINGIMGMTELALDTNLTDEQRGYLQLVKTSSDSLMSVINDILDFSKIEARKLEIEPIAFSLSESLDNTMKELSVRSHQKGLELICEIDPKVPDLLIGDPGRIRQVIVNLVGNAIKFTGDGEIGVYVDANCPGNDKHSNGVLLHFRVVDTGVGIPREKHQTIFNAFTQADTSTTRKYGGTGLGLTISSQLVSLMGGRMWVDSTPDKGSVFHFIVGLKTQDVSSRPKAASDASSLRDIPVLLIESNKSTARVVSDMLRSWHMNPTEAHSGEEALSILQQMVATDGKLPMIILDANMPELDAFAAANFIRKHQQPGQPGIVMLAYSNQSGASAGNIGHYRNLTPASQVAKPVTKAELLAAVQKASGKESEKKPAVVASRPVEIPKQRRFNVLLAEDNIVNQALAIRLLEKQRHNVTVANNGREALAAFSRQTFDLVLMDVQMPELDGFRTTGIIRAKEKGTGRRIPIIAMTAHAMKGDRDRCLAEGMDDYISKPIKADALYSIMEKIVAKTDDQTAKSGTQSENEPEYSAVYNFAEDQIVYDRSGEEPFDKVAAMERIDNDLELMAGMIDLFLEDHVNQIVQIEKAIAEGDSKTVERAAHKLKGAAGNFVAKPVCEIAQELETMGRNGDLSKASQAYERLRERINSLNASLTNLKYSLLEPDSSQNLIIPPANNSPTHHRQS